MKTKIPDPTTFADCPWADAGDNDQWWGYGHHFFHEEDQKQARFTEIWFSVEILIYLPLFLSYGED
jgi:hypothetical protein